MKAAKLHSLLTSEKDESVESALCPDCFVSVEVAPGKGGPYELLWAFLEKRKFLVLVWIRILERPANYPKSLYQG